MQANTAIEPRHDFTAKLRQTGVLPAVHQYILWQRATRKARTMGEVEPVFPPHSTPLSINLDLTTACNYQCDHCIDFDALNGKEKHVWDELLSSLQYMIDHGLRSVILIGGGEPTVHKRFGEMVRFLKERKVQVAVVSNGSRNHLIHEVAPQFTKPDWVRFSLDSGTNDTFVRMHKPRKNITLGEICAWTPRLREANPDLSVGFSFIITWEGALRDNRVPLIPNIGEMVEAAKLARDHHFNYISFKPILTRQPDGAEVMDPSVMRRFEESIAIIRTKIAEAKALETPFFRVVESTNLRVLLAGTWREFTKQPQECHITRFRRVDSPLGTFNCPAYRGEAKARIGDANQFARPENRAEAEQAVAEHIKKFNPSCECREITCLYQPTNQWIESLIANPTAPLPGEAQESDYFL